MKNTGIKVAPGKSEGRLDHAVRRRFAEAQERLLTADREIETMRARRAEHQERIASAERRVCALSKSASTSELRFKEEKEFDAALVEINRLRQLTRIADEEIAEKQKARELFVPALQTAQAELERLDVQEKRDALSAKVNAALEKRLSAEKALADAFGEENRCRFDLETFNDAIRVRHNDQQREKTFEVEMARRRQRETPSGQVPVAAHS